MSIDMKRSAVQKAARLRIEQIFVQLTDGCGVTNCSNVHCAASAQFQHSGLSRNEAAARAVQLVRQRVEICKPLIVSTDASNGISNDSGNSAVAGASSSTVQHLNVDPGGNAASRDPGSPDHRGGKLLKSASEEEDMITGDCDNACAAPSVLATVDYLTEDRLMELLDVCKAEESYIPLIRRIGVVFSSPDSMKRSFLLPECYVESGIPPPSRVDIPSLRRAMTHLFNLPEGTFQDAMCTSLTFLCRSIRMDLLANMNTNDLNLLNLFIILYELPIVTHVDFCEQVLPCLCKATSSLPVQLQAQLCKSWLDLKAPLNGERDVSRLLDLQRVLMQVVTLRCFVTDWERDKDKTPNDDDVIPDVCRVLKLVYYTCVLGGEKEAASQLEEETQMNSVFHEQLTQFYSEIGHVPGQKTLERFTGGSSSSSHQSGIVDALAKALLIDPLRSKNPLIAHQEFVNETLNEFIVMEKDYFNYRMNNSPVSNSFSFMDHSFLLSTITKNTGMYFDNRLRMIHERRGALLQALVSDGESLTSVPYLKLRVRRDFIVEDALVGLEIAAMENPSDLKKQLYVEFEGEQGIDEGGVSKEFFQLIIEAIFNPDYGMFTQDSETQNFWFNPASLENLREFTLVGCVLGLAIYNHVILNISFPSVLYRKLMGKLGTFEELQELHPALCMGLRSLLEYQGDDVEDVFCYTFSINETSLWGGATQKELKPGGANILVTRANKEEFVQLYADHLLNRAASSQFNAFRKGFEMVTDESPLGDLFRPDELEALVCGCREYDFSALKSVTEYDGGYTEDSEVVRNFWRLVESELTIEQQKLLLQFATGTDRVPVGGMCKMRFIIAKQGPDSDRLPSSHTCFNVLLLPEYSSKEKLRERLLKAIAYSKGFGML